MLTPILRKEFEKIRWPWLTILALHGLLMALVYADTRELFRLDHAEIVWYRTIHLGNIPFDAMLYAPVITGILLACAQFLPEMRGERLRLSLHLPLSPHLLVLGHVVVGLSAVGIILGFDTLALAYATSRFYPSGVVHTALLTALPWLASGLAAYLGTTLALLEPSLRLKMFNMAIAAGVTGLFLLPAEPGGYLRMLPWLCGTVLLMIPAVLLPAYHFRYRRGS
jgi:hypothetical protein